MCQKYCEFGEKYSFLHKEADHQPNERPKKGVGKGSVGLSKNAKQLSCVFQEIEQPKFKSILRKGTKLLGPKRCVRFTKFALRQNIPEIIGPSFGLRQRTSPLNDAPDEMHGSWPIVFSSSRRRTKQHFSRPLMFGACWRHWQKDKGKIFCRGFWSFSTDAEQEGPEFSWTGYCERKQKPRNGHHSQWWSADK